MSDTETLIEEVYSAFNKRVDGALALMTEDVSWPKASEGSKVVGKAEIRTYWDSTMGEFDPHVEPLAITRENGARIASECTNSSRVFDGDVLSDSEVLHVFTVNRDLIAVMDLGYEADTTGSVCRVRTSTLTGRRSWDVKVGTRLESSINGHQTTLYY